MEKKIGAIQQGVPSAELEMALTAWLDGDFSQSYCMEIASRLSTGIARQKKIATTINALMLRNPLMPYLENIKDEVRTILREQRSRPLLFTAITCGAFCFAYDLTSIMGKYFHAEDSLAKGFIREKVSQIYGSNRTVDIALKAVIPMLASFGMIEMTESGVYTIKKQEKYSEVALAVYKQSFLLNNSTYSDKDDIMSNPYFEFIDKKL